MSTWEWPGKPLGRVEPTSPEIRRPYAGTKRAQPDWADPENTSISCAVGFRRLETARWAMFLARTEVTDPRALP